MNLTDRSRILGYSRLLGTLYPSRIANTWGHFKTTYLILFPIPQFMYKASIVHLVPSCCRWVWNVSLHAELLHTLSDVHILWNGSFRTKIPKISVVEEVHDFYADCKCRGIYFSYYFVHCRKLTVGLASFT